MADVDSNDPDDPFEDTSMSLGEHLEELRAHMIRALLYLFVIMSVCLCFQKPIFNIATWPHRRTMRAIQEENRFRKANAHLSASELSILRQISEQQKELIKARDTVRLNHELIRRKGLKLGQDDLQNVLNQQAQTLKQLNELQDQQQQTLAKSEISPQEFSDIESQHKNTQEQLKQLEVQIQQCDSLIDRHAKRSSIKVRLQQLGYPEAFMGYLKVAFILALFLSGPLMGWEMWKFVASGLYEHEKRWVNVVGPLSFLTFIAGAMFGYFVLIPYGLHFLASYGGEDVIEGSITLNEYLSLFITLTLVVGVFFQLPLVMSFTTLIHFTHSTMFREGRRYFYLGSVIVSAFLTPPDPVTQILMWLPLMALYELGIWLSYAIEQSREDEEEEPEPEPDDDSPPALPVSAEPNDSEGSDEDSEEDADDDLDEDDGPEPESDDADESPLNTEEAKEEPEEEPEEESENEAESTPAEDADEDTQPEADTEKPDSETAPDSETGPSEDEEDTTKDSVDPMDPDVEPDPEDYPAEWFEEDEHPDTINPDFPPKSQPIEAPVDAQPEPEAPENQATAEPPAEPKDS